VRKIHQSVGVIFSPYPLHWLWISLSCA